MTGKRAQVGGTCDGSLELRFKDSLRSSICVILWPVYQHELEDLLDNYVLSLISNSTVSTIIM